jgi:HK97 family phage prohead protease
MANKLINLETKFTTKFIEDSDDIEIFGTANASEKDRDGDIILREAWEKEGALNHYIKNPIILAFHDHARPIGRAISYSVDDIGLHITAVISKAAGDVYELIKKGILRTFSVGFRVKDADYDNATDTFLIKELELYEVSVVSVPANPGSTFNVKKSLTKEEFEDFKNEFIKTSIDVKNEQNLLDEEIENMDKDSNKVQELEQKMANLAAGVEMLIEAQAKAEQEKAEAKKAAELEAKKAAEAAEKEALLKETESKITSVTEGTEKLIADLQKKLEDQEKGIGDVVSELRNELKEKSDELLKVQRSKMSFVDKGNSSDSIPAKEKDLAVLVAKATGKPIEATKFGKEIIEKYSFTEPGEHVASMTEDWESSFSTRMFDDIRLRLVVEPLFGNIPMTTGALTLPVNPEAGLSEWIARAAFENSAARLGGVDNGSTGNAQVHTLTDITLVAHKLAAKEYIGYEEEEDTILPIMSVVRDAIVRRMARSSDIAILRGDVGVQASAATDVYPFNGLATLAVDASDTWVSGGGQVYASREPVTVLDLSKARQVLGNWGLNPQDVVYIVSPDTYYELLQDSDFRTMDMVGDRATILTGQIGMVNGSPVIVSGEFAAAAADGVAALAVNTSNFYTGTLRGLMTERDKDIIAQQNVIVTTRRFDFKQIIASEAVAAVLYPSAT